MGTNVTFHLGSPDGLATLILDNIHDLVNWYTTVLADYPDECTHEELALAQRIASEGASALAVTTSEHAAAIDAFVTMFCFSFVGTTAYSHLLPDAERSVLPLEYYQAAFPWIEQHTPRFVQHLWRTIWTGRRMTQPFQDEPLGTDDQSCDGLISYWTADEVLQLLDHLQPRDFPANSDLRSPLLWVHDALVAARNVGRSVVILTV
jgi:hypothetical protein